MALGEFTGDGQAKTRPPLTSRRGKSLKQALLHALGKARTVVGNSKTTVVRRLHKLRLNPTRP